MSVFSNHFPDSRITCKLTPKVFWCVSFAHIYAHNWEKLDSRALKCIFVEYSATKKKKMDIIVIIHLQGNSLSPWMLLLLKKQFFFSTPYLQGETTTTKDKDKNQFLFHQVHQILLHPSSYYPPSCYLSHFLQLQATINLK